MVNYMKGSSDVYPYCRIDVLYNPNTYFYSDVSDESLVEAWIESRELVDYPPDSAPLSMVRDPNEMIDFTEARPTCWISHYLDKFNLLCLSQELDSRSVDEYMRLLRNFEAKKKVFCCYSSEFNSKGRTDFIHLTHYIEFAESLINFFKIKKRLNVLNALLKVNDILAAYKSFFSADQKKKVERIFLQERSLMDAFLVDQLFLVSTSR